MITLDAMDVLGTTKSSVSKLQAALLHSDSFLFAMAEIPDWFKSPDNVEEGQQVCDLLHCKFCGNAHVYEEFDDFARKSNVISSKQLTKQNKKSYPIYCEHHNGFTQLNWLCNRWYLDAF